MTLYKYSQTELNHCKNHRLHLVTYHRQKNTDNKAEMLIPEAYTQEKRADERVEYVNNETENNVTAAKYTLSLSPVDRYGKDINHKVYLVMFLQQPEEGDPAEFMTPETFMNKIEADQRVTDTNQQAAENIKANYYAIELYANDTTQTMSAGRAE